MGISEVIPPETVVRVETEVDVVNKVVVVLPMKVALVRLEVGSAVSELLVVIYEVANVVGVVWVVGIEAVGVAVAVVFGSTSLDDDVD